MLAPADVESAAMKLGFVSAILAELPLEDVFAVAAQEGFGCVELMCWPPGKAERRYAGVRHLDVTCVDEMTVARMLSENSKVAISGLGYYPNPLHPDPKHRRTVIEHLKQVITAAARLEVRLVNTFLGRDPLKSIPDNWSLFRDVWPGIVEHAEKEGVTLGIENCPMLFTLDEWPGGANMATTPD